MSNLHYKKDGSLDMRFNSSRAAMNSGSFGGSFIGNSYGSSSGGGGGLHYTRSGALDMRYTSSKQSMSSSSQSSSSIRPLSTAAAVSPALYFKKDGTLDMRYTSSREATNNSYQSPSSSRPSSTAAVGGGLHLKKDGTFDMRYTSSREAMSSWNQSSSGSRPSSTAAAVGGGLHLKKDGTFDMRYTSSREAMSSWNQSSSGSRPSSTAAAVGGGLHLKKDGTLDMRYNSSKQAAVAMSDSINKMAISTNPRGRKSDIPSNVPLKSDGTPDMRTAAAKQWVASAGAKCDGVNIPSWVPRRKDGTINFSTAVGREFAAACSPAAAQEPSTLRREYWVTLLTDVEFCRMKDIQRREYVPPLSRPRMVTEPMPSESYLRNPVDSLHQNTVHIPYSSGAQPSGMSYGGNASLVGRSLPQTAQQIDYSSLTFAYGDEKKAVIGQGAFGVVLKATLNSKKVAVKKLHLTELNKKEKDAFCKELHILAHLGTHQNLVELVGYCLNPPCIVMELVELGSLSYLLHYCEDRAVEAKMTDGRIKRKIVFGVANGMHQLHCAGIVHGDLKPQNILVANDYEPKVSDFGLATLRGKTSSTTASNKVAEEEWERGVIGGTPGYMAPELLDSTSPPEYSIDVYSFGIVLNEVISEEEPYADQFANFHGRGVFGAANYAKQRMRPTISSTTPTAVKDLITKCWSHAPSARPTFEQIVACIEHADFVIPNSI